MFAAQAARPGLPGEIKLALNCYQGLAAAGAAVAAQTTEAHGRHGPPADPPGSGRRPGTGPASLRFAAGRADRARAGPGPGLRSLGATATITIPGPGLAGVADSDCGTVALTGP